MGRTVEQEPIDLGEAHGFALEAVKLAARLLTEARGRVGEIRVKDGGDLTTSIDLEIEEAIKHLIRERYPKDSFHGEETGEEILGEYLWVVDPLDGTKHYARGLRHYFVSMALLRGREPVVGVVVNPPTGDVYSAVRGRGAFKNGVPIHVSERTMGEAMMYVEWPTGKVDREIRHRRFRQAALLTDRIYRLRGMGSIIDGVCDVAAGGWDAYIDFSGTTKFTDTPAAVLIAEEAGARVTDLNGAIPKRPQDGIVISNGVIHEQILAILR